MLGTYAKTAYSACFSKYVLPFDVCQVIQKIRHEETQVGELIKNKKAVNNFYNLEVDVKKST